MTTAQRRAAALVAFVLACAARSAAAQTRVVNMVPNGRSGETNQDAEPTITVDPKNFLHLVGTAFTSDNLTQGPNATDTAPIYVSTDGGKTWTLAFIVPSKMGAGFPTGDITVSFSATPSGALAHTTSWLYGGILSSESSPRPMVVLRSQDPFGTTVMAKLDTRTGNVDQPHTTAKTGGSEDKVYVGFNDGYSCVVPSGRTSTLDVTQDAAAAAPAFTLTVIEARDTPCQDGFAQVAAAHASGIVYAAFIHDWSNAPRLVVVRDTLWGTGSSPAFSALTDPSDAAAGRFVTDTIALPAGAMGQNRLGASNVSIAVDPASANRVYVAWGEANGANSETIHVASSPDGGGSWTDVLTVAGAMNPEVAINDIGVVGVLYQSDTGGSWETRFVHSINLDGTAFDSPGALLASQSASSPLRTFSPYIGDYASLAAAGNDFIGMFSASNYPDATHFPAGITYQREVSWAAHKLYADAGHTVEVAPSIDPFFFSSPTTICDRSRLFCNICALRPRVCYPIYDPWWWLKCPMCGITIFVNPGDEYTRVTVFDSRGKQVGVLRRLQRPVVERGVAYTHSISLKAEEGVGYVLRGEPAPGRRMGRQFKPAYAVRLERAAER